MKNNYFASWEDLTPGYEEVYLPLYTVSIDGGKTENMVLGRFLDRTEGETLEEACISMGDYIIECLNSSPKLELVCRRISPAQEIFEEKTALDLMEAAVATREIRKTPEAEERPEQGMENQTSKYARENWNLVSKVCRQHDSMKNLGRARLAPLIFILVLFVVIPLAILIFEYFDVMLPPLLERSVYVLGMGLFGILALFHRKWIDMAIEEYWRCPYCKEALPTYQRYMRNYGPRDISFVNLYNRIRGRSAVDMYGYRRVPKYVDTCPCCRRRIDNMSPRS